MNVPLETKCRVATWPHNLATGYILKGKETNLTKRHLNSHAYGSTIHNTREVETVQVSTADKYRKQCVTCTQWNTIQSEKLMESDHLQQHR